MDFLTEQAALHGHCQLLTELMDRQEAPNFKHIALAASLGGHVDIVNLMLSKGVTDYANIAYRAAEGGHLDIIDEMAKKCTISPNELTKSDVSHRSKFASPNELAYLAAIEGRINVVEAMIQGGADFFNLIAYGAAMGGHTEIVVRMLSLGADQYQTIASYAANNGCVSIVKLLLDKINPNPINSIAKEKIRDIKNLPSYYRPIGTIEDYTAISELTKRDASYLSKFASQ